MTAPSTKPRPFVKWVGGKRQLLPYLLKRMNDCYVSGIDGAFRNPPNHYNLTYHEPFVGGGALFFAVNPTKAVINDFNKELMESYKLIKNNPGEVIRELSRLESYYLGENEIGRKQMFEEIRAERGPTDFDGKVRDVWTTNVAARMIFLNKTCFNGLYRVNSKGKFNVPHGRFKAPAICDVDNLIRVHNALQGVKLRATSFVNCLSDINKGDFVYLDPPYVPLTETANFTGYTAGGFGLKEHLSLKDFCDSLSSIGANWMQSNSYSPWVLEIYKDYKIDTVEARRAVNRDATKRGKVSEVVISNF